MANDQEISAVGFQEQVQLWPDLIRRGAAQPYLQRETLLMERPENTRRKKAR